MELPYPVQVALRQIREQVLAKTGAARDWMADRWEYFLAVGAVLSLLGIPGYFPSEETLRRKLQERFDAALAVTARDPALGVREVERFLREYPQAPQAGTAYLYLARWAFGDVDNATGMDRVRFQERALRMARQAQACGVGVDEALRMRYLVAQDLLLAEAIPLALTELRSLQADRARLPHMEALLAEAFAELDGPSPSERREGISAARAYAESRRDQPDYPAALFLVGWVLERLDLPTEAIAAYQEALAAGVDDCTPQMAPAVVAKFLPMPPALAARTRLAGLLLGQDDPLGAAAAVESVSVAVYPRAGLILGDILMLQPEDPQSLRRALLHYTEALRAGPEAELRALLDLRVAHVFWRLEDRQGSMERYLVALREFPTQLSRQGREDLGGERILDVVESLMLQAESSETLADVTDLALAARGLLPTSERAYALVVQARARHAVQVDRDALDAVRREKEAEATLLQQQSRLLYEQASRDAHELLDSGIHLTDLSGALWLAGRYAYLGGYYPGADQDLATFLAVAPPDHPERSEAYYLLGEALLRMSRFERARRYLEEAVARHPEAVYGPDCVLLLSKAYEGLGEDRAEDAVEILDHILRSETISPEADVWREAIFRKGRILRRTAMAYETSGEAPMAVRILHDAAATFEQAVERYPQPSARLLHLYADWGGVLLTLDRLDSSLTAAEKRAFREQALAKFEEVLALAGYRTPNGKLGSLEDVAPRARKAFFYVADTLFLLGRHDEALDAYRISRARYQFEGGDDVLWALLQMAACERHRRNVGEAATYLEQASFALQRYASDVGATPEAAASFGVEYWTERIEEARRDLAYDSGGGSRQ